MKRMLIVFLIGLAMIMAGAFGVQRLNRSLSGIQSQLHFEAALALDLGKYHIVQIEVPRADGGGFERRCVYAENLLRAIMDANHLPYNLINRAKAQDIARHSPRHRFEFDESTIQRISGRRSTMDEACAIIASGRPVWQAEYSGALEAGNP